MTARALLVAAAFAAGLYATWEQDPVNRGLSFDNQVFYYIAVRVADGEPPHVSLVDHKHQLPAMISGAAIYAGRLLGATDVVAMRVPSALAAGVLTACVAWLAAELAGVWAGVIATLALASSVGLFSQAAMGVRAQVFMAAFMMLSLVAFGARRRSAAGLAAGCSFLCWQPAALVGAALAIASLIERERVRAIGALIVGALAAILAYEGYYIWYGALGEQVRQSYLMAGDLGAYRYRTVSESLAFFLRFGIGQRSDSSIVLSTLFLVALGVAPLWLLPARKRVLASWREHPAWPATLACSYLATALTFLTHEGYPDMFFVEPLIAVVAGVVLAELAALPAYAGGLELARAVVIGAAVVWLVMLHEHRKTAFRASRSYLVEQYALADQVDLLEKTYGPVWAAGPPHILALRRRKNFLPYGLLIDPKVRAYMLRGTSPSKYLPKRDGELPGVILSSRGSLRLVMPLLNREYRQLENRGFAKHGIQVWVRRNPDPE